MRKLSQVLSAQADTTESKPQTSKPASNSSAKPKADKNPAKKKTDKKESAKPRELNPMCGIKSACDARAAIDPEFEAKYRNGKKTIMGAIQYVMGQLINGKADDNIHLHEKELHAGGDDGKKMGFINTDNAKDDALAMQYFMDDSLNCEPGSKTKPAATSGSSAASCQPKDDADLDLDDLDDVYTPNAEEQAKADAEYRASKPCNRKPSKPKDKPKTEKPKAKKSEPTIFDDDLDDFDF